MDDPIEMVDGRGKTSTALQGGSEGSRATRLLLLAASKSRATDIHCEPKGSTIQVRMREIESCFRTGLNTSITPCGAAQWTPVPRVP